MYIKIKISYNYYEQQQTYMNIWYSVSRKKYITINNHFFLTLHCAHCPRKSQIFFFLSKIRKLFFIKFSIFTLFLNSLQHRHWVMCNCVCSCIAVHHKNDENWDILRKCIFLFIANGLISPDLILVDRIVLLLQMYNCLMYI